MAFFEIPKSLFKAVIKKVLPLLISSKDSWAAFFINETFFSHDYFIAVHDVTCFYIPIISVT